MANHESARTAGLHDRRDDQASLDAVERILIWSGVFLALRAALNSLKAVTN
jgi:hypothetical protein